MKKLAILALSATLFACGGGGTESAEEATPETTMEEPAAPVEEAAPAEEAAPSDTAATEAPAEEATEAGSDEVAPAE